DRNVTGVQTCALPIYSTSSRRSECTAKINRSHFSRIHRYVCDLLSINCLRGDNGVTYTITNNYPISYRRCYDSLIWKSVVRSAVSFWWGSRNCNKLECFYHRWKSNFICHVHTWNDSKMVQLYSPEI